MVVTSCLAPVDKYVGTCCHYCTCDRKGGVSENFNGTGDSAVPLSEYSNHKMVAYIQNTDVLLVQKGMTNALLYHLGEGDNRQLN